MKVMDLKVNHLTNPLGHNLDSITLSWRTDTIVDASEVLVATDRAFEHLVYRSGDVKNINQIAYVIDIDVKPRTRYFWKVCTKNNEGVSESDIAYFESGKRNEAWLGKWITSENKKEQSIILRKDFHSQTKPVSARMYMVGLGLYELEINGRKVSNEILMPGYHAYDGYIQYQSFDVTNHLQENTNQIGVILGNGWYKGRFGFDGGYENLYGQNLAMICELHLEYEDGSEQVIVSDSSWTCCKSMILENNIYDGEALYGNQYLDYYSMIDIFSSFGQVKELPVSSFSPLQERRNPEIQIMETKKPVALFKVKSGDWILDFGQNMAGWVEFDVNEKKGKKVILQYAEHFQHDDLYNVNLRTAKSTFVYHSLGIKQHVRPHFTFFGFRYVKVSGIEQPKIEDFKACVIYSQMKTTGKIVTKLPLVNKLVENIFWGQKGNFLDIPTDCPQRDERMGWTGDAQIFSTSAAYNMDVSLFFAKYMYDVNYEQSLLYGAVPNIVPRLKLSKPDGFIDGYGASPWADAATIIPWNMYVMSGDIALLKQQYKGMKAWVDYAHVICEENGNPYLWTSGFHFGDWLALDNYKHPEATIGATDSYFVASVYYHYSTLLVSKAAKALGNNKDYQTYEAHAIKIKENLTKEYFTPNGRISIDTQTARVLAIHFDLLGKDQLLKLGEELASMIVKNDMHLDTGFVGTPMLCSALTKTNQTKYAFSLLLNESYPSWLYEVKMGATTVWERWNSINPDGTINETGMNSLNHYAYGAVIQWMYQEVAGIQPLEDSPGFKEFKLYPNIDGRMGFVDTSYSSMMGGIKSSWEVLVTNELKCRFIVPMCTVAHVRLPIASDTTKFEKYENYKNDKTWMYFTLTGGEYDFVYKPVDCFVASYNVEMDTSIILKNEKTKNIVQKYMGEGLKAEEKLLTQMGHRPFVCVISNYQFLRYINPMTMQKMNNELMSITYEV